jgi:hypothetical protein
MNSPLQRIAVAVFEEHLLADLFLSHLKSIATNSP